MATTAEAVSGDLVAQLTAWAKRNRRGLMAGAAVVVVIGGGVWFSLAAKSRKEAFAARALRDAEAALGAGNLALATSDLARLVGSYRGTPAAAEGALLLGQLRLSRGQADSAVTELRHFIASKPDPRFLAAAYGLLGTALEQAGRVREAGEAYEQAARLWPYEYLRAQALLDAGRAFRSAGDTTRAAAAYQRILREFQDTPSALEAKLRLGELGRADSLSS